MWRDLPIKYHHHYETQNWKHTFKCAKLKLKGLVCCKPYTFRQDAYDQPAKDVSAQTFNNHLLRPKRAEAHKTEPLPSPPAEYPTRKRDSKRIVKEESGQGTSTDSLLKRLKADDTSLSTKINRMLEKRSRQNSRKNSLEQPEKHDGSNRADNDRFNDKRKNENKVGARTEADSLGKIPNVNAPSQDIKRKCTDDRLQSEHGQVEPRTIDTLRSLMRENEYLQVQRFTQQSMQSLLQRFDQIKAWPAETEQTAQASSSTETLAKQLHAVHLNTTVIQVQMNVLSLQSSIQALLNDVRLRQQLPSEQRN